VEIIWLMLSPLYGQADAGAIWNRTLNHFLVAPEPAGLGFERNVNDPCIYTRIEPGGGRVTYALYVDDARLYNDPTPAARELAGRVQSRLKERFEIKFGETNPKEDYFLGANRVSHGPHATTIPCDTYIGSMVERYYRAWTPTTLPSASLARTATRPPGPTSPPTTRRLSPYAPSRQTSSRSAKARSSARFCTRSSGAPRSAPPSASAARV